ncbi:MAG: hypothetical protein DCC58_07110 [Chloroflexi bacterium]|nr:MAG: hypothetical protein DCC58_07110 [Chloroflexota bacterium]
MLAMSLPHDVTDQPTTQPPTRDTLRAAARAAYAAQLAAADAQRLADAQAELPRRAFEYLGGLLVSPDMLDGEELLVDTLRFRLAPSGGLLLLARCSGSDGLCWHEVASLADVGRVLGDE